MGIRTFNTIITLKCGNKISTNTNGKEEIQEMFKYDRTDIEDDVTGELDVIIINEIAHINYQPEN